MEKLRLPDVAFPKITLPCARLAGSAAADKDYIKDGLVFWLDGINKGDNEGAWTDLIKGLKYSPPAGGSAEFGSDYVRGLLEGNNMNYFAPPSSVEVAFRCMNLNTVYRTILFKGGSISSMVCFIFSNGRAIYSYNKGITYKVPNLSGDYALSANTNLMLGNLHTRYYSSSPMSLTNVSAQGSVGYKDVELCSVRIYDRLLTEEEMRHNQEVDKRRFKLDFPEPVMTLELDEDDYAELSGTGVSEDNNA